MLAPLHTTAGHEFLQCLRNIFLPKDFHLSGEMKKESRTVSWDLSSGTQQGLSAANQMKTLGPHQSREHQEVEEELPIEPSTGSSVAVGWNNSERNEDGTCHFLMDSLGTSSGFYSIGPSHFQQDHNRRFQPLPLYAYIVLELLCLHFPSPTDNHFRLNSCFTAFFLPSDCVTGWHIVLPMCGGIRSEVRSICMSRGRTDSNFFVCVGTQPSIYY